MIYTHLTFKTFPQSDKYLEIYVRNSFRNARKRSLVREGALHEKEEKVIVTQRTNIWLPSQKGHDTQTDRRSQYHLNLNLNLNLS
jgi:hypothetical protein